MKNLYFFLIQVLMVMSLVFLTGCKQDTPLKDDTIIGEINPDNIKNPGNPDNPNNPGDPDDPEDPEKTITANISETISIYISAGGYIRWTAPDNFYLYTYPNPCVLSICDLGKIDGLGYITEIPQTGYTTPQELNSATASETGHGYVIKIENKSSNSVPPQYVRLYVVESLIHPSGLITGKKVKYEYPFDPTDLTVSTTFLSFPKVAGNPEKVNVTTKASEWTCSANEPWIMAAKVDNKTLTVSVLANNGDKRKGSVFVETNENRKEIVIEQNAGVFAVGELYDIAGVTGIVYKIEDTGLHGMIVSMEEVKRAWSTLITMAYCSDTSNGMNNMNVIRNTGDWENYPAFKWCNDFNKGGISGWYLPAQNELQELYNNRAVVNKALKDRNKDQLQSSENDCFYWSSSEHNRDVAVGWDFFNGNRHIPLDNKRITYRVRAVHAF